MNFDEVKNFMDRLTAWRIPGNSITVYKDNKKVFEYSSGYSDLENKIPMNGSELLGIWSCSKIATVTAALQLYEKGYFLLYRKLPFLTCFLLYHTFSKNAISYTVKKDCGRIILPQSLVFSL